MRIVVYPGSFDPITFGHIDLVRRGMRISDLLIVAVLANPNKKPLFTVDERVAQVKSALKGFKRVKVMSFDGLTVKFLRKVSGTVILRGLRAVSDFEFEFQMALMNRKLDPGAETVYLMPAEQFTYLSSRAIKEIVQFGGDVTGFVPAHVKKALERKLRTTNLVR